MPPEVPARAKTAGAKKPARKAKRTAALALPSRSLSLRAGQPAAAKAAAAADAKASAYACMRIAAGRRRYFSQCIQGTDQQVYSSVSATGSAAAAATAQAEYIAAMDALDASIVPGPRGIVTVEL
jgi:hypothetical protein